MSPDDKPLWIQVLEAFAEVQLKWATCPNSARAPTDEFRPQQNFENWPLPPSLRSQAEEKAR